MHRRRAASQPNQHRPISSPLFWSGVVCAFCLWDARTFLTIRPRKISLRNHVGHSRMLVSCGRWILFEWNIQCPVQMAISKSSPADWLCRERHEISVLASLVSAECCLAPIDHVSDRRSARFSPTRNESFASSESFCGFGFPRLLLCKGSRTAT